MKNPQPEPPLYPRQGWNQRWTTEVLLDVCDRLDQGETLTALAAKCQISRDRLKYVVGRFLPRRERILDRLARPEYWAKRDARSALRWEVKQRQEALAEEKLARKQAAEARKRHKKWLATREPREDGTYQLWDPGSIR